MQLKNWTIIKALKTESYIYYLKGNVFGHTKPTCSDGTYIHTSSIVSAEDNGSTLSVRTKHSLYIVSKTDMDNTISVDTVRDFCGEYLSGGTDLAEMAEAAHNRFLKNGRLLSAGMLYLQLALGRENYFAGALYCGADGVIKEDHAILSSGMFDDSVILSDAGARWFMLRNGVEFYEPLYGGETRKKTASGYIRNVGAAPIAVTFSFGGTVTIMPGKLYEVKPPEQGSAGK